MKGHFLIFCLVLFCLLVFSSAQERDAEAEERVQRFFSKLRPMGMQEFRYPMFGDGNSRNLKYWTSLRRYN
ncbi:unnamed protein product, partial [Mesorhabditis belari]|uniref:Uncharacterized protein n=1 Tax=Mesorhabditis belari TaxID=2138241 RepID=A0A915GYY8_9BILA